MIKQMDTAVWRAHRSSAVNSSVSTDKRNTARMSAPPSVPGFGWTTPAPGKVTVHPESHIVDPASFPGDAPGRLLALVDFACPNINQLVTSALKRHGDGSPTFDEELREFLDSGKSNGRTMKWHLMKIAPNVSFSLHAHPNIELIYVFRGTMNELRLDNSPPKRSFDPDESAGPSLSEPGMQLTFSHRQTNSSASEPVDRFLVNEKGSVHLSYTTEEGAELLVLWSGAHANIPLDQYPPNAESLLQLPGAVKPY
jgi:hypothetical protein